MAITASKLGISPLTWDWTHLAYTDLDEEDLAAVATAKAKLKSRFQVGEIGFYDAPTSEQLTQAEAAKALALKLKSSGQFKDCLFLGIGGSSLGPISLLRALREKQDETIRFHFIENPDPLDWKYTISKLDPESTLVVTVTKSGTTYETISLLMLALAWLTPARLKTHFVAITDPKKGELRAFVDQQKLQSLSIAPSIGGRFSIFTPVGLFPMALAGLSVDDFLKGAGQIWDYCEKTADEKNPLWITASTLLKHAAKRSTHVMMPYATGLKDFSSWFVQLWGESLGKDGKGFTPIASLGATDQHSILQLLRDGPDDKITFFVRPERVDDPVKITKTIPLFEPFCGPSLNELLEIEYQAISKVLTRRNRPNLTVRMTQLDERSLGALYYAFACLTAFTGTLMQVDPFDQPGVEEGKIYIREALERARSIS